MNIFLKQLNGRGTNSEEGRRQRDNEELKQNGIWKWKRKGLSLLGRRAPSGGLSFGGSEALCPRQVSLLFVLSEIRIVRGEKLPPSWMLEIFADNHTCLQEVGKKHPGQKGRDKQLCRMSREGGKDRREGRRVGILISRARLPAGTAQGRQVRSRTCLDVNPVPAVP